MFGELFWDFPHVVISSSSRFMAVVTCCRQSPLSPPKRSAPRRLRLAALQHIVVPMSVRLGPFTTCRHVLGTDFARIATCA